VWDAGTKCRVGASDGEQITPCHAMSTVTVRVSSVNSSDTGGFALTARTTLC